MCRYICVSAAELLRGVSSSDHIRPEAAEQDAVGAVAATQGFLPDCAGLLLTHSLSLRGVGLRA